MRRIVERIVVGVFIALVLGWIGSARSATITISRFPPHPGVLPGGGWEFRPGTTFANPPPVRAWVNGVYGGVPGARVTDAMALAGRAGSLPVVVGATATGKAIGVGAARCVALLNPYCIAGAAAYVAYEHFRVKPDGTGGLLHDPGTVQETVTQWCVGGGTCGNGVIASGSVAGACTKWVQYQFGPGGGLHGQINPSNGFCAAYSNTTGQICGGCGSWAVIQGNPGLQCPQSIDPFNPAYNVPAGMPVGYDGKCPTARYNHAPIAAPAAGDLWGNWPLPVATDLGRIAKDATDSGQTIEGETIPVTGPASQTGQPTTTTEQLPDGTTRTTTQTPSYSYNYGNTSITYNTITTTIVNHNGQTTTTTETVPGGEVDSTGAAPQDAKTDCDKFPDNVACTKLGEPPVGEPTWTERPVNYEPESLGLPSGCPADRVIMIRGWQLAMSYAPLCDQAPILRAGFLALVALGVALMIINVVRT